VDLSPEAIRAYRAKRGLSQEGLARLIGCSWTTIAAWEAGRRRPTGLYAKALERVLQENAGDR
jgi:DNA-binding transcriptional regulator YiaG